MVWRIAIIVLSSLAVFAAKPHIVTRHVSADGREAVVVDQAVRKSDMRVVRTLLSTYGAWHYSHAPRWSPVVYGEAKVEPDGTIEHGNAQNASNRITWWSQVSVTKLQQSPSWKRVLKPIMERLWPRQHGNLSQSLHLADAIATMHRNGDYMVPERWVIRGNKEPGWVVAISLNEKWHRDGYGELTILEEDGEFLLSARPRFGQVVIFDASLAFLSRPASASFRGGQLTLFFWVHPDLEIVQEVDRQREQRLFEEARELEQSKLDMAENSDPTIYTVDRAHDHVSRRITTPDDTQREIIVRDRYLLERDLEATRRWVRASFENYHFDDSDDDGSDNVVWIASFDPDEFVKTRVWSACKAAVEAHSGRKGWFPYDVAVNLIESGDKPRIHTDCMDHEFEFTMLFYLNRDWGLDKPLHYGETVFFSEGEDDGWPDVKDSGNASVGVGYDVITAVRPAYGRMVIFPGTIPHSARPPSYAYGQVRLTLAVKVSPLENIARRKSLRELVEVVDDHIKPRIQELASSVGRAERAKQALQDIDAVLQDVVPTVEAGGDIWGEQEPDPDAPSYGANPGELAQWSKRLHDTVENALWNLLA